MQFSKNWLAIVAAVLFAVAWFQSIGGDLNGDGRTNAAAWALAGLFFLALSQVVVFVVNRDRRI